MSADDVEAVVAIENRQFTTPWSAKTFEGLLERTGAELWVLDHAEAGVIAYAVMWLILDHGELANIAVQPEFAGKGFARNLLDCMLDLARQKGVRTVFLEVRKSNKRAADLYRSFGFEEIGRRKRYYEKPIEDALVMRLEI